ncbi:putative glycosyltransferase (group 1) [Bradyrhizobium sp. ORS 375]|uniref:glycosyltransferase family 4 protein n=1 Tax=Bradyrhizobium sp. (strain ORS 375) TaxID=566679 RepID=UPI0002405EA7|nr:glycosyltransferase family 4 protein [Bradyrhizobium sp. ORS 375]CCD95001.1 putative glycosyltransferase (group 1) [Bradyrhizobium sp. ORS 375]
MTLDTSAPDVMDPAPPAQGPAWRVSAGAVSARRLNILNVSHMPASPPRFGAQARMHGLMTQLAHRHDVTAVSLVDEGFDLDECRQAMQAYCRNAILVRNRYGREGLSKRLLQLRSLVSMRSFDRLRVALPELQSVLDRLLTTTRFDIVNLEFPYLGHCRFRQAPVGERPPRLVVDSHEIAYDLARQFAATGASLGRRLYAGANWRKLRREELAAYAEADGVYLCSNDDETRLHDDLPNVRTAVIPNAADTDFYQPRSTDPAPDGRTLVYFGLLSTVPNIDAVTHFVQDIWPAIAARHPDARCKIIGGRPPPSLTALAGPGIELTGFVPDLRPHLAAAAAVIVPLRLGGGTRLKIVEAMAMGKAIVSTSLGAEGIEAVPGRDILIADDPTGFAEAVSSLLAAPDVAARIGSAARQVAVEKYAWSAAAQALESFYCRILETSPP